MGFQGHYRKLQKEQEVVARRPRWLRKGKAMTFRLFSSPSKRLKWVRFSVVVIPKRVSEIYAELLSMIKEDAVFPTINFSSSQLGLPVLSHPSVAAKKRQAVSLHRDRKMHAS